MKDNLTTYKIWAPDNALWTQWAKPVLFASEPIGNYDVLSPTETEWASEASGSTMIILDLPGITGIDEGLSLANKGYRPVPLYNGVFLPTAYSMIVDVSNLVRAIYRAADKLSEIPIKKDAPPVFLLDSNRMEGGKEGGRYDNRWCVFPQDMPSASFLISHGIKKIIVRAEYIHTDLSHILKRYQDENIDIYLCRDNSSPQKTTIPKPSQFRSFLYRFQTILGLTRNPAGGFGGQIPEPVDGYGYYGVG